MEKLDSLAVEKKISEIYLAKDRYSHCTAWIECPLHPERMFINLNGVFARWEGFWEAWLHVIITHETIHAIIYKLEGSSTDQAIDNLWTTTTKSRFLVDGNPKWFKWKEYKK